MKLFSLLALLFLLGCEQKAEKVDKTPQPPLEKPQEQGYIQTH